MLEQFIVPKPHCFPRIGIIVMKKKNRRPWVEKRSANIPLRGYHLQSLCDQDWHDFGRRFLAKCDALMDNYAYGSPDALSFGWDWPTFRIIFPRVAKLTKRLCAEQKRRENDKATEELALFV